MTFVGFSEGDAKRIANVVKRVEQNSGTRPHSPDKYSGTADNVWIKITDADYSTGKYAWTLQVRKDDGTWDDDADDIEGTLEDNYAIETNTFKYVPDGAVVCAYHLHDHMVFLYDNYSIVGTASGTIGAGGSGSVDITIPSGAGTISVSNPGAAIASGKSVLVEWFPGADTYVVSPQQTGESEPQLFVNFQLTSELAVDAASITVNVLSYWGGSDPGSTITVYNIPNANSLYAYRGFSGDKGIAVWDAANEKFWIDSGLRPATPREFIAVKTTPSTSDSIWDVASVYSCDGGPLPAAGISAASNPFNLRCHFGEQVLLCEDFYAESIYVKQVYHTTIELVEKLNFTDGSLTQTRYLEVSAQVDTTTDTSTVWTPEETELDVVVGATFSGSDFKIQKKTISVFTSADAAESTVFTADSETVVTDTDYSEPSFTETKKTLLVLPQGETSSSSNNVFTATSVGLVDDISWTGSYLGESKTNVYVLGSSGGSSSTVFTAGTTSFITDVTDEGTSLKKWARNATVIAYTSESGEDISAIEDCE
jgi:hypothetical protein